MHGSPASAIPPPAREGVGAGSLRLPPGPWPRVLDFLVARFPGIEAEAWRARLARGLVLDGAGEALAPDAPYRAGATVWYYRELPEEPAIPFEAEILHRDAHLVIADKPHFLPVVPAGRFLQQTLLVRLRRELGLDALTPLHRIDRGTAGLVAFSADAATRGLYQRLFATRAIDKRYEAFARRVEGLAFPFVRRSRLVAGEPFFRMREAAGEPNSETVFESCALDGDRARYRLRPLTGKKHQLRVHLAAIGAAIENDPLYPSLREDPGDDDFLRPLKLLARELAFVDPVSGEARRFVSRRSL